MQSDRVWPACQCGAPTVKTKGGKHTTDACLITWKLNTTYIFKFKIFYVYINLLITHFQIVLSETTISKCQNSNISYSKPTRSWSHCGGPAENDLEPAVLFLNVFFSWCKPKTPSLSLESKVHFAPCIPPYFVLYYHTASSGNLRIFLITLSYILCVPIILFYKFKDLFLLKWPQFVFFFSTIKMYNVV